MWEGSMPEGVSLSQALGEEGQTSGGECKCIRSFILVTVVSPLVSHLLSSPARSLSFCYLSSQILWLTLTSQPRGWWEALWCSD